jgi:hypothetical protein
MSSQVVCFVCNLPILTHQVNNEHKSINQGTFFLHLFLFGLDILNPTNSIQTKENNKKKKMAIVVVVLRMSFLLLGSQVGLVWQGGNGIDELLRDFEGPNALTALRTRLGRRDSATQFRAVSPPR